MRIVYDEFPRSGRKVALYHIERFDVEDSVVLSIDCVEVRWRMIAKEKLDDDSIKSCDFGHVPLPFLCPNGSAQAPNAAWH